jgi:iron(III) transport system permease protein
MRTLEILGRTSLLIAAVTACSTTLALALAWLTARTDLPFRNFWTIVTSLPLVIPSYVGALLVIVALGPRGMLQGVLEDLFGLQRLPDLYGFPGALLILTLLSYPYVMLPLRAALSQMDPSLEEASRSLGMSRWATFRRVTLPLLRPAIASGALLVALYTLSDFGAVSLMRYETFTWAIYLQYESAFDRTLAAALSSILVIVAIIILLFESRTRGQSRYHKSSAGAARKSAPVPLGAWKWPGLAFCAAVIALTLLIPLSILSYWTIRGIDTNQSFPNLWTATANSLKVSALAALVVVLAALPVAFLSVRFPNRLSSLLERATYVGFGLPGIVIALSLVFFGARYITPLYQTLPILIFAYGILFLPAAVGAARVSLLQLNPRLEEAGRSLGKGGLAVIRSITLPLMRPGLLAGAALVFLLTMKELPATLILSPIGFRTLATQVWDASSEAFFARAAANALILVLVSSIPMAILVLRDYRSR